MFPAPPFSMFRWAIDAPDKPQAPQSRGRVQLARSWCADPLIDSDDAYADLLEELALLLDRSDLDVSFSTDELRVEVK